ncbi:hypothetical protein MSHOH_0967 [Methanosarcina horonobensis HB-1 = JCM 15518]|uniref:Uncharacterized protein n=2 Tax=Methanosarcina horonobensis TaxID=418008 RepID=A0A0E3WV94_9EURY|nr:hypothetical protein MSHOH_0967 [Methanosarcina horonobensis HB-1 = JCM 15518]
MMRILVFFGLLFGLFGIFMSQYILQYRTIYQLWIKEIVYYTGSCGSKDKNQLCNQEDSFYKNGSQICSQVESYCREICDLANALIILFLEIIITGLISLYVLKIKLNEVDISPGDIAILRGDQALVFVLLLSVHSILKASHIDILHSAKTSEIDRKLFHIWCKVNCHTLKAGFQQKLEPPRMYVLLRDKIIEHSRNEKPALNSENEKEEMFIYEFISKLKEDQKEWNQLLALLEETRESSRWNPLYRLFGDIDQEFLRYLVVIATIEIIVVLVLLFDLLPEFSFSDALMS